MFRQKKLPPFLGLALVSGLVLAGCGQAPATTAALTSSKAATVSASNARIDIRAIEASIKKQLEKNVPDLSVRLTNLKVWAMPTIQPYPAPVPTLFGFSAIESVTGFTGRTEYYEIEGTYDLRKSLAIVTSRVPMKVRG